MLVPDYKNYASFSIMQLTGANKLGDAGTDPTVWTRFSQKVSWCPESLVTWCGVCGCDCAGLTRGTPRIETKIAPNSCFHSCHLHIIFSRAALKPQLLVYLILQQDVPHISIWRWSRYTLAYSILVRVRGCAVVKTGLSEGLQQIY